MTRTEGARRLGTAFSLGSGEMISRVIGFAATAYLASALGPSGFGVLGFALAVVSYASVPVGTGFTDLGARDVARDRSRAGTLAASATAARMVVAAGAFVLVAAASPFLTDSSAGRTVLILSCGLIFVGALDPAWVFKGLGRGIPVAASLVIRRLGYALLVFLLVDGPDDLTAVPVMEFAAELLGVVWLAAGVVRLGRCGVDWGLGWRMVRDSASLMATKLFRTSILTLDVVILGLMATDRDVGLYSAPYRFCFFVMAVAGAIQVAYLPDVSRADPGRPREEAVRRHLEIAATLAIPMFVGGALLASQIITLLFGAEYEAGTGAFRVLLGSVAALFLFSAIHNLLLAEDRLRTETRIFAVAAAANLVLNLIWIPRYGIVGAAWATVVAEVLILVLAVATVWGTAGRSLFLALLKPALASAVMAAVLVGVPALGSNLLLGIPAGALVYALVLGAVGGIPQDMMRGAAEPPRERDV